jgi:hypothetical protein
VPEIKEIPDEDMIATFLKQFTFSSMGAIIFAEEVRVNDGFFCSEETGAEEDTGNVKLGDNL